MEYKLKANKKHSYTLHANTEYKLKVVSLKLQAIQNTAARYTLQAASKYKIQPQAQAKKERTKSVSALVLVIKSS